MTNLGEAGASLSLQMHHHRAEHWVVVKGTALVSATERSSWWRKPEHLHPDDANTASPTQAGFRELIEIQAVYLGEDDIVRFQDRYGRQDQQTLQIK